MRRSGFKTEAASPGPVRTVHGAFFACVLAVASIAAADDLPLTVRITSPLGRTGVAGTVRIVAQVHQIDDTVALKPVRFYVDQVLLKTVEQGPPYAVEWVDENPFAPHEIAVEIEDDLGRTARDAIALRPYEIVEVTQVFSVVVDAAVRDRHGRFIAGLAPSNFILREEGVPQHLEMVTQEAMPATFALLIDSSQSMSRRVEFVRHAAGRLVDYLRPNDRVLVAPFSQGLGALTGPTDDRATVLEAIGSVTMKGGTAILDALVEIAERVKGGEGRRAVILMTDGYDEKSVHTVDQALDALKQAQTTVYVVGIGGVAGISLRGERMMRRLAAETGGQAFFPPREEDLTEVYDTLAADAQNRYVLTYTPANQKQDGSWRAIELASLSKDHLIQARPGYFAPKAPPVRPTLEFTVTDASHRYVDVTADDLIVLEDGVEQKVESFQEAVMPVSVVLALDASGSMRRSEDAVVEAAVDFVDALRPEDSLAVVMFNDRSVFAHDLSTNRDSSLEAISEYQTSGGTALYDALTDSLIRLKRVEGRRVVVVVTDGRDENNAGNGPGSQRTFEDVLARLKETEATMFGIGLGPNVDRTPLERIAGLSGGQAYFPQDVSTLREEYARIVENLRRRFVLSYASTNPSRDGGWRKVEIRVRSADLLVASRGGYFAPER